MSDHLRNYQMEAEQYRQECDTLRNKVRSLEDECWRLRANLKMQPDNTYKELARQLRGRNRQLKKALELQVKIAEVHDKEEMQHEGFYRLCEIAEQALNQVSETNAKERSELESGDE